MEGAVSPIERPMWKELRLSAKNHHQLVSQVNDHCGRGSPSPCQAFR